MDIIKGILSRAIDTENRRIHLVLALGKTCGEEITVSLGSAG